MVNQIINTPNSYAFQSFSTNVGNVAVHKPITQQQQTELEQKKKQKSHALGITIASSAILTGLATIAMMKGMPSFARKNLSKMIKNIEDKASKNQTLTGVQKFCLNNKDYLNSALNFASFKDVIVKKATDKIPFVGSACKKISGVFEQISIKAGFRAYNKSSSSFTKFQAKCTDLKASLPKEKSEILEKQLESLRTSYDTNFGPGALGKRFDDMSKSLNGLDKDYWESTLDIKGLGGRVRNKSFYTSFHAEEVSAARKQALSSALESKVNAQIQGVNNLLSEYRQVLPTNEFEELKKVADSAITNLKKSASVESDNLFDKVRDIKLGSAPTDVMGVISAFTAAAIGLAKADGKDEKISAALQFGIPAVGAVSVSLLCTASLVAAGPALGIGLVSGIAIGKLGEFVDKKRKQYAKEPSIINGVAKDILPTLAYKNTQV